MEQANNICGERKNAPNSEYFGQEVATPTQYPKTIPANMGGSRRVQDLRSQQASLTPD